MMIKVWAKVSDLEGFVITNTNIDLPYDEVKSITGHEVMKAMALEKKLTWGFTTLGGKPVVTEIVGRRSSFPTTAWILTHLSPVMDKASINAGMDDILVNDGDILEWRMVSFQGGIPSIETIPLSLWLEREQTKVDQQEKQREENYRQQEGASASRRKVQDEEVDEWEF